MYCSINELICFHNLMTSLFTLWDYMNIVFAIIAGIFNFQLLLYMFSYHDIVCLYVYICTLCSSRDYCMHSLYIFDIDSHFPHLLSEETSHPHHLWDQKSEQRMEDILDRFPMSISTIWGNHLPFNFMLKFPIYYFDKPFNQ